MRNLLIGLLLGAATSVCAQAMLTRHYEANTDADVQKCLSEVTEKSQVSFKLEADGVNFDYATCWPEGIDIAK